MFSESPRHHSGSRRHSREGTRVFINCLKKCNFGFFASELWNMFCIQYQFRENSSRCAHALRNFQFFMIIRHFETPNFVQAAFGPTNWVMRLRKHTPLLLWRSKGSEFKFISILHFYFSSLLFRFWSEQKL